MGVQYGIWNFHNSTAALDESASDLLMPYGPDGKEIYRDPRCVIILCAFSTPENSRSPQLITSPEGIVIAWDGRLDNRKELRDELGEGLSVHASDAAIVSAGYAKWETDCFRRLVGEWAAAVWHPGDRTLLLAKDHIGSKHLYYSIKPESVTWSSLLAPLVFEKELTLNPEYLAGWLSSYPAATLTPYDEVHSVPPCSFVRIQAGRRHVQKYWDFDGAKTIRYPSDRDYEEHFFHLFEQSVGRRLRSDAPILAELSGGMDSSAIVSMADRVTSKTQARSIDTVSYYSDVEPNWDERPYFTKVERKRGKTGVHFDAGVMAHEHFNDQIPLWPGSQTNSRIASWMSGHGHRVLLSGTGGDEFLGGAPTPIPELENLLIRGQFRKLAHQLKVWALIQRRPWPHLLRDTAMGFLPLPLRSQPLTLRLPWLERQFVERYRMAFHGYESRWRVFGPLPSFQENLSSLERVHRQLAATELSSIFPYEKRYPYLDRDLLEFLFAIPREQLVRPGERRSLMRRALRGIVPDEILDRRRKAYATLAPLQTIANLRKQIARDCLVLASQGILVPKLFFEALDNAHRGKPVAIVPLLRTLALERWLQRLKDDESLNESTVRIAFPLRQSDLSFTWAGESNANLH